ncbi:MAG: endopeptidase La [Bacteroidia bacterium]|nr:MAG: endopeptidase La [Bacteroidia bacterium]
MAQEEKKFAVEATVYLAEDGDGGERFVPFMSGFELGKHQVETPEQLPLVELRNNVFFPQTVTPISIGRSRTRRLVKELHEEKSLVAIVAQRDPKEDIPGVDGLYDVGTLAVVHRVIEMPDGNITLLVEGVRRLAVREVVQVEPFFVARCEDLPELELSETMDSEMERVAKLHLLAEEAARYFGETFPAIVAPVQSLSRMQNPTMLMNFIAMQLSIGTRDKQELLAKPSLEARVVALLQIISMEMMAMELREEIQQRTKTEMEQQQREFILQQQIRTIQDELGEGDEDDYEKFEAAGKKLKLAKPVREAFNRELQRLRKLNPMAPDYSIQTAYLQLFTELPWGKFSKDNYDLQRAKTILDEDHFGLEKVKDRILEFLAVLKLKNNLKSPILCLYGPPGVGKTSLGKSIARALGRKYARISLGGVHDESEIRGHRRTYIGAMPGRIVQNLRKVKSSNPVFILDEVDKLTSSPMGDPASALLEVLDPEQNTTFHDNYLEVEYDLSRVLFITTANDVSAIPAALRDRMEMIEMTGYLMEEKVAIARDHLIPKQLEEHGVKAEQFAVGDELLERVITEYTRESGVRKLNQELARMVRHRARFIAGDEPYEPRLTLEDLRASLGTPRFLKEVYDGSAVVGVSVGMAWTQVGGQILYVESSLSPGEGKLTMTGSLGNVMKESTTIALQLIKARQAELGIAAEMFKSHDVHVHVPEGAIPKDGPSAGVTMLTSLVSSYTGRPPRSGIAMTGEITLRGKVLPVGGIKEKILAAKRANLSHIVLPADNRKDIEEIKEMYIRGLEFSYVEDAKQLLGIVF